MVIVVLVLVLLMRRCLRRSRRQSRRLCEERPRGTRARDDGLHWRPRLETVQGVLDALGHLLCDTRVLEDRQHLAIDELNNGTGLAQFVENLLDLLLLEAGWKVAHLDYLRTRAHTCLPSLSCEHEPCFERASE